MKLRFKFLLPLLLLVVLVAAYAHYWWLPRVVTYNKQFYHEMLNRQLDAVGEGLVPLLLAGRLDDIHDTLNALARKNPEWMALELTDRQGSRLYPLVAVSPVVQPGGDVDSHQYPLLSGGVKLGALRVVERHDRLLSGLLRNHFDLMAALLGLLTLFIVAFGVVLDRWVRRPLSQLVEASSGLAAGRFDVALPEPGRDEVGQLAAGFAAMRDAIRRSRRDLEREIYGKTLAEQSLRKSEAFLRTLFSTASEGIWVLDENHKTVQHNQALLEMLGTSEHDMLYRPVQDFLDGEGAKTFSLHTATSQREGRGDVYEIELIRADGARRYALFHTAPLYEEGEVIGSFALVSDITEQKKIANSLQQLNETLEQRVASEVDKNRDKDHLLIRQSRLAAMGEMIGNIAHQWRQPLNALGLMLANIKDAQVYGDLNAEYLDQITAKARRLIDQMSSTIDDFRNFFKPNRKKECFGLRKAVLDAFSIVEAGFRNHGIELRLEGSEDAHVLGFPSEFSQVMLNLLTNARDAILSHGIVNGRVMVQILHADGVAKVRVCDNGGGITPEVLDKIFDPYFTTREKGTGIGLYMSKMIVENNMGGRIEVRNARDGAEFMVIVPENCQQGTTGGELHD